jgi:hypothetical protein
MEATRKASKPIQLKAEFECGTGVKIAPVHSGHTHFFKT